MMTQAELLRGRLRTIDAKLAALHKERAEIVAHYGAALLLEVTDQCLKEQPDANLQKSPRPSQG